MTARCLDVQVSVELLVTGSCLICLLEVDTSHTGPYFSQYWTLVSIDCNRVIRALHNSSLCSILIRLRI